MTEMGAKPEAADFKHGLPLSAETGPSYHGGRSSQFDPSALALGMGVDVRGCVKTADELESSGDLVWGAGVKRFVEGQDRSQLVLLPECLDDFVGEDNPVRVVDAFLLAIHPVQRRTARYADWTVAAQ